MKELWVSMDRYGVMRPTKNVPKGKITNNNNSNDNNNNETRNPEDVEDHPEWKTKELWLHWDLNPCNYSDYLLYIASIFSIL